MRYLGLQVLIVVFVVGLGAGVGKDAAIQLVGHVDARQALHSRKVGDLLVAVVVRQAHGEHAGIVACRHTEL